MLSAQNLTKEIIFSWNTEFAASGAIAEQVVGQELLAYSDPHFEPRSYYWARDKKGSSAEIDFITSEQNRLVPIEVKAGATGKLKSLRIFMQEKGVTVGVRISQHQLSLTDGILSVPFYAISSLGSLLESTRTTSP
jgi:predicted AAA+ superfamily ATPase